MHTGLIGGVLQTSPYLNVPPLVPQRNRGPGGTYFIYGISCQEREHNNIVKSVSRLVLQRGVEKRDLVLHGHLLHGAIIEIAMKQPLDYYFTTCIINQ